MGIINSVTRWRGIINSVTRWRGLWVLLTLSQGGGDCGYYYLGHKVEGTVGIINSLF